MYYYVTVFVFTIKMLDGMEIIEVIFVL